MEKQLLQNEINPRDIKCLNGNILIKLRSDYDKLVFKSGVELYIDTSFEPEQHAAIVGEVINIPNKIQTNKMGDNGSLWETEVELEIGDEVVVSYQSVVNALKKTSNFITWEGELYVIVRYWNIFVGRRGDEIIPVNGFTIMEPVDLEMEILKERLSKLNLVLPDKLESIKFRQFGRVVYTGEPKKYVDENVTSLDRKLEKGDIVFMASYSDFNLEHSMHRKFFDNEHPEYIVCESRDILAIIK